MPTLARTQHDMYSVQRDQYQFISLMCNVDSTKNTIQLLSSYINTKYARSFASSTQLNYDYEIGNTIDQKMPVAWR